MKTLITSALIAFATTSTLMAAPITFEVTELRQKVQKPGVLGADVCYVHGKITNGTPQSVAVTMNLLPTYKDGSLSAMLAPSGLSFGNTDSIVFGLMQARTTQEEYEGLLGADCADITEIVVQPACANSANIEVTCPAEVVLLETSVLPVRFKGSAAPEPVNPEPAAMAQMDGAWHIQDDKGRAITKLQLSAPMDGDITGTFKTTSNLCKMLGEPAVCPTGYGKGEIRYASHADSGKVTIQIIPADDVKITFLWNFETGQGKVVNQRGTLNKPITARLAN